MTNQRIFVLGLSLAPVALACGSDRDPGAVAETTDSSGLALLTQLRARHWEMVPPMDEPGIGPSAGASTTRPVLASAKGVSFQREGVRLRPVFSQTPDASAPAVKVALPVRGAGAFRVEAPESGLAVDVTLRGARDVDAELADGYAIYRGAAPEGGTVLHRPTASGTEDYLTLERRPARAEVVYQIALSPAVAGLRLVADGLELLDAAGTPRLRVAPPYLVGADGNRVDAKLALAGCAADRNPAPPWDRPVVRPGAARCDLVVSWQHADAELAYPAILDPSWSNTASMSVSRTLAASCVLGNGLLLVAGGANGNTTRSSAELYNPQTRTWATTGSMTTARRAATANSLNGGAVIVGGRSGTTGALASAERYFSSTGTFSATGSLSVARFGHTATNLSNGNVLAIGGTNANGTSLDSAQLYAAAAGTWDPAVSLGLALAGHSATRLPDNSVLLVSADSLSSVTLDPAQMQWSQTGQPEIPRRGHTATSLASGKVLIAGGTDASSNPLASAEVYDPPTRSFSRVGNMWHARQGHRASSLSDGRVAVTGNVTGGEDNRAEIFDPTHGTWAPVASTTASRSGHISATLPGDRVLVAGGTDPGNGNTLATAAELDAVNPATSVVEYKLPAAVDANVFPGVFTELWAAVYRPLTLASGTRYPLIVFLHGNHGTCGSGSNPRIDNTCEYTATGTCPLPKVVVPSHTGYAYIATELAARGFIVVSVNANRGINCGNGPSGDPDAILVRSRLVLSHLRQLSAWNRNLESPPANVSALVGHIDFTRVGLMGHSRGGPGMRGAYQLYREAGSMWRTLIGDPITFRGIFEIGPAAGLGSIPDPDNVAWNVLLPMCDDDNTGRLPGQRSYDRFMSIDTETTPLFKSTYAVHGANHNYYNTQWQTSEVQPSQCVGQRTMFSTGTGFSGSAEQRQTGFLPMLAFFETQMRTPAAGNRLGVIFDPRFPAPVEPRVDRNFATGLNPTREGRLEDFVNPTGTSTFGVANQAQNITLAHDFLPEHDGAYKGGIISWTSASNQNFFQSNWAASGTGFNFTGWHFLDLRVDRASDPLNTGATTNFTVRLINGNGTMSGTVNISDYVRLAGPVAGPRGIHSVLQTARIPLSAFSNATLSSIRGVRLTFSSTSSGKVYVGSIRVTWGGAASDFGTALPTTPPTTIPVPPPPQMAAPLVAAQGRSPSEPAGADLRTAAANLVTSGNSLISLRSANTDKVDITVTSTTPFEARDDSLIMRIGDLDVDFITQRTPDLHQVTFRVDRSAFDRVAGGEPVLVRFGREGRSSREWSFGGLDRSRLDR